MPSEIKAVEIEAEVRQVKSLTDGSCNLILNIPEYCMKQMGVVLTWIGDHVQVVISNEGS